ncbi:chromate transporter [uncultured Ruminococcus sp.]|uniref:chromate transporter n=1 Tax=uncultured Ruminococcus sp. TaxID=165186 RepID=UPI0025F23ADB|nr:chromate transporter [uncultured Ruminococcus sp.]
MKKKTEDRKILTLFLTFFKIGAFTFGGGYAMIALLENEFSEKKNWLTKEEFIDMTAISESTPGPTAINSATFIGYKIGGFLGAFAATIGVCIPSFLIIYIISLFFDKFLSLKYVGFAFKGIQVGVIYLIFSAGIRMLKSLEKNLFNSIIIISVITIMTAFSLLAVNFSSVFYILICGVIGLMLYYITKIRKGQTVRKVKEKNDDIP